MSRSYPAKKLDRKVVSSQQFTDPISGKQLNTYLIEKDPTIEDPIPYQTYFLGLDIADLLGYKDKKGLIKRIPTENKYIITNANINIKGDHWSPLNTKLSNRGSVIIDFGSVNYLLSSSKLDTSSPYQVWISTIMNSLFNYGYYMDPIRTYNEINNLFSRLLYSYTPAEGERNIIDICSIREKKLNIIKNNGYISIAEDPNLKRRIYNLAFMTIFNLNIFSDPNYSFINNPFKIAYDICGYDGVMIIKGSIDGILAHLMNGASIEFLESWYSKLNYNKLYAIPNGEKYREYHIQKANYIEEDPYVDNKHSYGVNVDNIVDKE